ncbi:DUF927 domain-containing protein [Pandoraea terrigena]|uniref:DNA primase n=1 Tax=Pandoraea terrigena TaxID=2508292 RepID=A0A5E4UNV0_9BURK|nr:DUF927 domain-containing protein [Pandoraea terrigena]VVE01606.1 DNA primase [Pandoraea terrigena]
MSYVADQEGEIRAALEFIECDDRDDWLRVGMGLKDELGDRGFPMWDDWSQGSDKYKESDARATWRSLKRSGITIRTVFNMARANGFTQNAQVLPINAADRARRRAEAGQQRAAEQSSAKAKLEAQHMEAARVAAEIWEGAAPAPVDHPYLARKNVQAHGVRIYSGPKVIADMPCDGCLIVPIRAPAGALASLEFIRSDGEKRFLWGGRKSGGFYLVGDVGDRIAIGEGFATCASVEEHAGIAVAVAFDAGNMRAVAEHLRAQHPNVGIVMLADNDECGTGEKAARAAAEAVGGIVALPSNGEGWHGDFNDLAAAAGGAAVQQAILHAHLVLTPSPSTGSHADGCVPIGFTVSERGVFYEEDDGTPHWICSPLHVRALVRDRASENWGRLLEWHDADGHPHVWAMPMEMLRSDGADMRGELARLGLDIAPGGKARNKLTEYVTTAKPKARGRCVTRTGWHGGAFVFPDRTIGEAKERVIFQAEAVMRTYSQAGTLDDWKQNVARLCSGNSRMLVAVSTAFAGMMLSYSGQESGGLNIVGDSSTGKTTALRAACSVFGGPEYMQRWRATSNGLEGLAALHNDTLLVLDELAQVDPREAGEIAYMLANGSGKARAGRTGAARARQTWRLLFLSAGEIGLAQHMQAGGKRAKAGQEVRLVEIPADAGAGHGLFETLHGMSGGAQLSSTINDACSRCFGTPALEFLSSMTAEPAVIEQWLKSQTADFLAAHLPADANGQAHRVCQRFALIGLAGEYATSSGITGWADGEALQAAATCFAAWLENRGGAGNHEKTSILSHVKAFFEAHEESRFTDLNDMSDRPTINRAGFRRNGENGVEYLVLPEVFKREICAGFEPKSAAKALVDAGWIRPSPDGKFQRVERLPGKGATRLYVFSSVVWDAQ